MLGNIARTKLKRPSPAAQSVMKLTGVLFFFSKVKLTYLKLRKGGQRPTKLSIFKFFWECWLFFSEGFNKISNPKMSKKMQRSSYFTVEMSPALKELKTF